MNRHIFLELKKNRKNQEIFYNLQNCPKVLVNCLAIEEVVCAKQKVPGYSAEPG